MLSLGQCMHTPNRSHGSLRAEPLLGQTIDQAISARDVCRCNCFDHSLACHNGLARPTSNQMATDYMSRIDRYVYVCPARGYRVHSHGAAPADLWKKITSTSEHCQEAIHHSESCYRADRGRCNVANDTAGRRPRKS